MKKFLFLSTVLFLFACKTNVKPVECNTIQSYQLTDFPKEKTVLASIIVNDSTFALSTETIDNTVHFSATKFYADNDEFTQGVAQDTVDLTYFIKNDTTLLMSFKKTSFDTCYFKVYRINKGCLVVKQ
jgi:hypothetical protein